MIDGGSIDGTLDIAASHRDHFQRVVSAPDQGIYDALNKGIALVQGEIIGTLHADDLLADEQVIESVLDAWLAGVTTADGQPGAVTSGTTRRTTGFPP